MRESTFLIATLFRLVSIALWSVATMNLVVWITHPIAIRIDPWGTEVFDPHRLAIIVCCTIAGVVVYALSLPIAVRVTAAPDSSRSFSCAFTAIRIIGFCSFVFASVYLIIAVFNLIVCKAIETRPGHVRVDPRWVMRNAFTASFPFLFLGLLWPTANHLARAITKRFNHKTEG